jgi:hypothetical protein
MGSWVTMEEKERRIGPSYEWTYEWYPKEDLLNERV